MYMRLALFSAATVLRMLGELAVAPKYARYSESDAPRDVT
jgi:hypothetical protein